MLFTDQSAAVTPPGDETHDGKHYIINCETGDVLVFDGHMHRKIKGRAYRSYWLCLTEGCAGKIMLNDLKGGSIAVVESHQCPKMFKIGLK